MTKPTAETTESRTLIDRFTGPWNTLAYGVGVGVAGYYIYIASVGVFAPQIDRSLFIAAGLVLAFIMYPLGRTVPARVIDLVLLAVTIAATLRFNLMYEVYLRSIGLPLDTVDILFGWAMILLSLEACRRVLGPMISALGAIFLVFLYFGNWIPEPFTHSGFDAGTIASYMYASTDGIYGSITYILAIHMFLFLVFGQFLIQAGASDFFSRLSTALLGHHAGGTAKAAVASSGIVGSITGSEVGS